MAKDQCSTFHKLYDLGNQLEQKSPEASKNLTDDEHKTAEKLAADVRQALKPAWPEGITEWKYLHEKAVNEANGIVDGIKDKSRLDGILADANKLLSKDDEKLLQTSDGVVVGKRSGNSKYWVASTLKGIDKSLDCDADTTGGPRC